MRLPIDKDVPPPIDNLGYTDKGISRTLRALQPGDSFLIPGRTSTYASRIIHREKKRRPGSEFISRTREGGVRIWCIRDPRHEMLS